MILNVWQSVLYGNMSSATGSFIYMKLFIMGLFGGKILCGPINVRCVYIMGHLGLNDHTTTCQMDVLHCCLLHTLQLTVDAPILYCMHVDVDQNNALIKHTIDVNVH